MQNQPTDLHSHFPSFSPFALYAYRVGSAEALPTTPYSAGIHPWDLPKVVDEQWIDEHIKQLLDSITACTVAIGEIGLDYQTATSEAHRALQQTLLLRQLEVARNLQLPVILHCVHAYNDLIPLLKGFPFGAIVHGFTGSAPLAAQVLGAGLSLSFGWSLLHSPKTCEALQITPPDRLFLESDNDPRPLDELYHEAAHLLGTTADQLNAQITLNYKKLFESTHHA